MIWALWFRAYDLGFRVYDLGFRVYDLGFRAYRLEGLGGVACDRVWGLGMC